MAVTVHEAIMVPGDVSIDVDFTPETYALLWDAVNKRPRNLFIRYRNPAGVLKYPPFVLRRVDGDEGGLTIGGPGILWALGAGAVGPPIEDREFFSGVSRLWDGGYELDDLLYWKRSEGSTWTTTGAAHSGALAAYHATGTDTDDPLASDIPEPAAAGEEWTAGVWVQRSAGAVGRIHLRLAFGGRFTPADVLIHDWNNTSEFPGDMDETSPGVFRVGPNTRKQILTNGSFETGNLDYWRSLSGAWAASTAAARTGVWSAKIDGTTPAAFRMLVSDSVAGGLDQGYDVLPGETYVVGAFIAPALADGKAWMNAMLGGVVGGVPNTPIQQQPSIAIENNNITAGVWSLVAVEVQVPADAVLPYLSISLITEEHTVGTWHFDDVAVIRTIGNRGYLTGGTAWNFVPLRSYVWSGKVDGSTVVSGNVRLGLTLIGVGRPNLYMESPPHDVKSTEAVMKFAFTPPSGYEYGSSVMIGEDIVGGSFFLTDMHCYDQDTTTVVIDTDSAMTTSGWAPLTRTFTAPVGTDKVWMEVVAEADAGGWAVDDASLTRTGVTISTCEDVARAILLDPITGDPMSIGPGTITAPAPLPYDWRLLKLTSRAALDHMCNVVYPGGLEYRVTAEESPLLDVAAAASLFTDHTPDGTEPVVLLGGMVKDPDVADVNPPETDVADRATEIVVIGAERTLLSGRTVLMTASAPVPGPVERDLHNRPIVRRRYVSAGTVDHLGYAQALADDLAAREAEPALSVPIVLNEIDEDTAAALGIPLRPEYAVGDWIYVEKPEAGLRDPAYSVMIDGTEYFPRRVRVLERERGLLNGTIEMVAPDGTVTVLDGVDWSEASETRLTVGDRLLDWVSDPQGKAEGVQYLSDRQSRPR